MILYGAGGHAKVVYHSLVSKGVKIHGIFDDNPAVKTFLDFPVLQYPPTEFMDSELIICIGSNRIRHALSQKIKHSFGRAIDPTAYLADGSGLEQGSVMLAKSIVQVNTMVGKHAIINTGAIIEHDCEISDFAHIGPGSVVCGNVYVGFGAFIGANVTILPGLSVGDWAVVGAGSVVVEDVSPGVTIAGNPAKTL